MTTTLKIAPGGSLRIRSNTLELLELEAVYGPAGSPPPKHWHPEQDEHFEVLEGSLRARAGDRDVLLGPGETIDIPRRTVHQFWNPGSEPARVIWQVRPAGRTADWFASIDALYREGRVGRAGTPGALAFAVLLTEFPDVFRLATPAAPLVRAALATLAPLGRLRGYRPVVAASRSK
jgi:mannose-6-phosphate isomerase-like protein (cupin superfamily)